MKTRNMNEDPKTRIWKRLATAAAALTSGVLLVAAPDISERIIVYIFAGVTALVGIAHIILKKLRGTTLLPTTDYASGLTVTAFGIFLMIRPDVLTGILSIVLAVLLIYVGFAMLERALGFFLLKARRWWIPAACAVPVLFTGFWALIYPFDAATKKWVFLGISLLVVAVLEVAFLFLQRRSDILFGNEPAGTPASAKEEPKQEDAPFIKPAYPEPGPEPFAEVSVPGEQQEKEEAE